MKYIRKTGILFGIFDYFLWIERKLKNNVQFIGQSVRRLSDKLAVGQTECNNENLRMLSQSCMARAFPGSGGTSCFFLALAFSPF